MLAIVTASKPKDNGNFIEYGTHRAVPLKFEENTSSIYQMAEINLNRRHAALLVMNKAACPSKQVLRAVCMEDSILEAIEATTEPIAR